MDFEISQRKNKILVRLKQEATNFQSISNFCHVYKEHLTEADRTHTKLSVLFDLRLATFTQLHACSSKLQPFFSQEIKPLSERTISSCIVVVANKALASAIQMIINAFPGKVPTTFTDKYPSKQTIL